MTHFLKTVKKSIKHWYLQLIAGILLLILGIYVLSSPVDSYLVLAIFFSIGFIAAGIAEVVFAFSNKDSLDGWGWYLVGGLLSLVVGVYLVMHPDVTLITLPFIIGFTVMFRSFQALGFAYELRNYGILDWGNLAIIGSLGVIFSFILIFNPVFAGLTIVIWTGIAIIMAGIASIYLSLKLKKLKDLGNIPDELKSRWEAVQKEVTDTINQK